MKERIFLKKFSVLMLTVLLLILPFVSTSHAFAKEISLRDEVNCAKVNNLKAMNHRLWENHVFWTGNYITSAISGLENKQAVLERLLKNQTDIGNFFEPYYGKESAKKIGDLFTEHITLAGQLVEAAKSNNKDEFARLNDLWYKNGDAIVDLLSGLNPNWSKAQLRDMFHKHLQLVTEQVVTTLNKDWKGNIATFDKGEEHMLNFADIISEGIVKQFPNKFK